MRSADANPSPIAIPGAVARLGLGTAQFGPAADPSSPRRRLTTAEAFATVALAADAGVRLVETSPRFGGSERMLGQVLPREPAFEVITKTAFVEGGVDGVMRQARASLRRLGLDRAAAILVHPADALLDDDGPRLWAGLQRLKDEGLFGAVGISACLCDDPVGLARRFRPDLMQLPLSLLDQRILTCGVLETLAAKGVEAHLRSVFLQGLLFASDLAAVEMDPGLAPQISRIRRLLAEAGADPMQAALGFALSRPEASKVVVGIGSPMELRAVLAAARAPAAPLDWEALRLDAACRFDARACIAA